MAFLVRLFIGSFLSFQTLLSLAEPHHLDPVVITAPVTHSPLIVITDTKAPRQPIPAHDGADLLKNIPGFAIIRKGGTDGDPLFRGMAASRLSILLDGETILGGCGNRMDPPTAYIFPEAFDTVTILKGPQSVKHASSNSAGIVLFERATPNFHEKPVNGYVSALQGSFGRNDQVAQIQAGGSQGYIHLNGTHSHANDYISGNNEPVHSSYTRWSSNAAIGWTPTENIRTELTTAFSDGEASYADRAMDGSQFTRKNIGFSYEHNHISPLITQIKARIFRNYVDHVMDNYRLRTVSGSAMAMNPDRDTVGAILISSLQLTEYWALDVGIDHQRNEHTNRSAMSMMGTPNYKDQMRIADMNFSTYGVFAEANRYWESDDSVHLGLRINYDTAEDLRVNKTTSNTQNNHWLTNAFMRYEHQLSTSTRSYAGIGYSERAADYWERTRNPEATSGMMAGVASTFELNPEQTTQLDIGATHKTETLSSSMSIFIAQHHNYILIESLTNAATNARNIHALTFGGELDVIWQFNERWNSLATFAWVYGENLSDRRALGQMPAPEMRLGLNYDTGSWFIGALWRGVSKQARVAPQQGNIIGQDIGKTSGYSVFSMNTGVRVMNNMIISAGIDNVFNTYYAEHISRSGAMIPGYATTERIPEPGRNLWLKAQYSF